MDRQVALRPDRIHQVARLRDTHREMERYVSGEVPAARS